MRSLSPFEFWFQTISPSARRPERAPSTPRARPEHAQSTLRARPEHAPSTWSVFRTIEKDSKEDNFFLTCKFRLSTRGVLWACSGRALGALWARSGRALGALSSETPRRGRGPVGAWSVFLLVETALALEEREFPLPGKHVSCFDFRNTFARCPIERSVFGTCLLGARSTCRRVAFILHHNFANQNLLLFALSFVLVFQNALQ